MTKTKKSLIVMAILSVVVILATTLVGIEFWRSHMAMTVDTSKTYLIGETDLTDQINYFTVTSTYLTGAIMIIFGGLGGLYLDLILWGLYGLGYLACVMFKKMRTAEASAQEAAKTAKK